MKMLKLLSFVLFLNVVKGGVLIISPQYLEIPSLRLFDEKLYHSLKDSIENGRIVSYLWELPIECGYFGNTKNSAYLPSVIYYPEDAIGTYFISPRPLKKIPDVLNPSRTRSNRVVLRGNP